MIILQIGRVITPDVKFLVRVEFWLQLWGMQALSPQLPISYHCYDFLGFVWLTLNLTEWVFKTNCLIYYWPWLHGLEEMHIPPFPSASSHPFYHLFLPYLLYLSTFLSASQPAQKVRYLCRMVDIKIVNVEPFSQADVPSTSQGD